MIKLNEKEIECIKKCFTYSLENIKKLNKEELIELIRSSGTSLQDIMLFENAKYLYENINDNEFANEKVIRAFADSNGFWVWVDKGIETAEELAEYINCKEICSIYEKYLELIN